MSDHVDRLTGLTDPFKQLREATDLLADAQREVTELARFRRGVITDLRQQGWTYAQIAERAGLTRGRIHQIRAGGPAAEGAFLGSGAIVIVTPLKRDEVRGRPVVAVEDVAVATRLTELARSMSLDAGQDHVSVGGDIDLNRPNLIVVCGPRLSQPVADVLAQDPFIRWQQDDDGVWIMTDQRTGQRYRSGQDQRPPQPRDVGYLGRLARPDGKGSLLIFTGVHPQGSLGIAQFLATDLADLYRQVKTDAFSVLIGTEYDPETGEPRHVEALTPITRHQET